MQSGILMKLYILWEKMRPMEVTFIISESFTTGWLIPWGWAAIDVRRGMAAQNYEECFPIIGDLLSQPVLMGYRIIFLAKLRPTKLFTPLDKCREKTLYVQCTARSC